MKKIVIAVIFLGIVAVAGAVWYVYQPFTKSILSEDVLPGETVAVLEAVNLKQTITDFQNSPLGKALAGIDLKEALRRMEVRPEETAQILQLRDQLRDGLSSPWFDTLFGDRVTLAFMPESPPPDVVPAPRIAFKWIVMVLKPRQPAELISYVGKMLSKDIAVTSMESEGVKLDRLETEGGQPLFLATRNGLGFIALDPAPIVRCLSDKPVGSTLAQVPQYQALREELNNPDSTRFFSYVNLHDGIDWFFDAAKSFNPDDKTLKEAKEWWVGFSQARPVMATAMNDDGGGITHARGVLRYDKKDLSADFAKLLNIAPQKNETLDMMPADVLYYSWQNNLKHVLNNSLNSRSIKEAQRQKLKSRFKGATGMELQEVVDAFGDQLVILCKDILTGGLFPVPELAIMLAVEKPDVMERLADTVLNGPKGPLVPIETEDTAGIHICYAVLPYGDDISPCYACGKGFCVLSSNRTLLKSIFTLDSASNLHASEGFKAVDKGLTEPSNQVAYLNARMAVERIRRIMKWGLSFAAMSGKVKDLNTIKYFSENVATPIFDGMAMYQNIGLRSVVQENGIQTDFYVQKRMN
jgi:hypothetical protein